MDWLKVTRTRSNLVQNIRLKGPFLGMGSGLLHGFFTSIHIFSMGVRIRRNFNLMNLGLVWMFYFNTRRHCIISLVIDRWQRNFHCLWGMLVVTDMNFQEQPANRSRNMSEKVLWSRCKVFIVVDQSQRWVSHVLIFREAPPVGAYMAKAYINCPFNVPLITDLSQQYSYFV